MNKPLLESNDRDTRTKFAHYAESVQFSKQFSLCNNMPVTGLII